MKRTAKIEACTQQAQLDRLADAIERDHKESLLQQLVESLARQTEGRDDDADHI